MLGPVPGGGHGDESQRPDLDSHRRAGDQAPALAARPAAGRGAAHRGESLAPRDVVGVDVGVEHGDDPHSSSAAAAR